jgi:hypothetical protein
MWTDEKFYLKQNTREEISTVLFFLEVMYSFAYGGGGGGWNNTPDLEDKSSNPLCGGNLVPRIKIEDPWGQVFLQFIRTSTDLLEAYSNI